MPMYEHVYLARQDLSQQQVEDLTTQYKGVIEQLGGTVGKIEAGKTFFRAEGYHQDYALHNPDNPYILVCDRPKIEALKAEFPDLFKNYKGR